MVVPGWALANATAPRRLQSPDSAPPVHADAVLGAGSSKRLTKIGDAARAGVAGANTSANAATTPATGSERLTDLPTAFPPFPATPRYAEPR